MAGIETGKKAEQFIKGRVEEVKADSRKDSRKARKDKDKNRDTHSNSSQDRRRNEHKESRSKSQSSSHKGDRKDKDNRSRSKSSVRSKSEKGEDNRKYKSNGGDRVATTGTSSDCRQQAESGEAPYNKKGTGTTASSPREPRPATATSRSLERTPISQD